MNDILEDPRIPRKPGQPANSKKHSDLYTDENPKNTIHGLKFATEKDAIDSVKKIKNSGRSHAHKIQAAVAMEQRAKEMGKTSAAAVYRNYINSIKKTNEDAPVNAVGGGHIAGVGVGPKGEPGRSPMAMLRRKRGRFKQFVNDNQDKVFYKALGKYVPAGKSSSSRGGNGGNGNGD